MVPKGGSPGRNRTNVFLYFGFLSEFCGTGQPFWKGLEPFVKTSTMGEATTLGLQKKKNWLLLIAWSLMNRPCLEQNEEPFLYSVLYINFWLFNNYSFFFFFLRSFRFALVDFPAHNGWTICAFHWTIAGGSCVFLLLRKALFRRPSIVYKDTLSRTFPPLPAALVDFGERLDFVTFRLVSLLFTRCVKPRFLCVLWHFDYWMKEILAFRFFFFYFRSVFGFDFLVRFLTPTVLSEPRVWGTAVNFRRPLTISHSGTSKDKQTLCPISIWSRIKISWMVMGVLGGIMGHPSSKRGIKLSSNTSAEHPKGIQPIQMTGNSGRDTKKRNEKRMRIPDCQPSTKWYIATSPNDSE